MSGSSQLGVFFRVILPLLRPVIVYGGGVALLLGLGQFTGPLLLGRNAGINVLTTDMSSPPSRSHPSTTARPPALARHCCCSGSPSWFSRGSSWATTAGS